jgi:hypothetical protein
MRQLLVQGKSEYNTSNTTALLQDILVPLAYLYNIILAIQLLSLLI